jgi:outer membrane protein assembly factor BamB
MIVANKDDQHATPFGDRNETERLPEELRQVARRYAALPVPRPTAEETSQLIGRLQARASHDLSPLPVRPPRRQRRVMPFLEVLAAVLVVGILVGSFLLVLALSPHLPLAPSPAHDSAGNMLVSVSASGKAFSGKTTVVANRASDGRQLWSYVTGQTAVHPALSVHEQVVYAKLEDRVYALRIRDGRPLWQTRLPWPSSTPDFSHDNGSLVMDHGMVFAQLYDGVSAILFALSANNGKVLWQYQTGGEELFPVANGQVYTLSSVTDTLGHYPLVALQETTGKVLWSQDVFFEFQVVENTSIAVGDNIVYVAYTRVMHPPAGIETAVTVLLALDAQSGKMFWYRQLGAGNAGPVVIEKGKIILFNDFHFCAYRVSDGQDLWCTPRDPSKGVPDQTQSIPFAIVNDILYVTYSNLNQGIGTQLEALDVNTRTVIWSKTIPDRAGLITIMDSKVYLIVDDLPHATQSIFALSVNDGRELWQHGFPYMISAIAAGN